MEAGDPSLSLVGTYQITRHHIPEENNLIVTTLRPPHIGFNYISTTAAMQ
jgi:hypothetical protein